MQRVSARHRSPLASCWAVFSASSRQEALFQLVVWAPRLQKSLATTPTCRQKCAGLDGSSRGFWLLMPIVIWSSKSARVETRRLRTNRLPQAHAFWTTYAPRLVSRLRNENRPIEHEPLFRNRAPGCSTRSGTCVWPVTTTSALRALASDTAQF
jgi:hypothetical protein